jgi:hypothetical protein
MLSIFRKPQTKARCGSAQYDVVVDRDRLDERFHESCHKRGIHLGFPTPIYVTCAQDGAGQEVSWQRGGGRLNCSSEMRIQRS